MDATTRSRWLVLTLLLGTLAGSPPISFASHDELKTPYVWGGPTLHLLWNDSYDLFPSIGFGAMRGEVERIFARDGISVRVHRAGPGMTLGSFTEPVLNVVLTPAESALWNLERDVMAAAIGESGKMQTIFVFYPDVKRTLKQEKSKLSPAQMRELTRAMGRIVAHELVHVVAPERGHAESGLMAPRLTRKALIRRQIALDAESRSFVRKAIASLADAKERLVAHGPRVSVVY